MRFLLSLIIVTVFLWTTVYAQSRGVFTQPSGSDGSNTFKAGDTITIAWSGIASYPIFSLGIESTKNGTISWLISDSRNRPTSIQWTVDVLSLGFNIKQSQLFTFYACNGTYAERSGFTLGFSSPLFNIDSSGNSSSISSTTTSQSSTSTTSSTNIIPSSSAATVTVTIGGTTNTAAANTDIQSGSSNSLSTAAKAGIGVGIGIGAAIIIGMFVWFVTRRRKQSQSQPSTMNNRAGGQVPTPAHTETKLNGYFSPDTAKHPTASPPIHEISSDHVPRAELPANEGFPRRVTELATNERW